MKSDIKRTRLLVLNQYYAPGVEATAHLLSQLCEALSDEFDVTVITGMLRDEPELRGLIGYYLRRAECVVAIGETMRVRLQAKGAPPDRVEVIANWVDTNALRPNPRKNRWAIEHGLENGFVVMHSGNIGHAQDLDS